MMNALQLNNIDLAKSISNNTEIAQMQLDLLKFQYDKQLSIELFKSEVYGQKFKSESQIFVILQEGRTLGMTATESLNGLYQVKGGVEMFGASKTAFLTRRGYSINYSNEEFDNVEFTYVEWENNQKKNVKKIVKTLVKTTVTVANDKESYTETFTIEDIKNQEKNDGLKNAPQNKLRYEALNKIIKTNLAGKVPIILAKSEDDYQEEVKKDKTLVEKTEEQKEKIELLKYIQDEANTIEALAKIESLVYDDLKQVYQDKLQSIKEETKKITKEQLKLLHTLLTKNEKNGGEKIAEAKQSIYEMFSVASTKELSEEDAKTLIDGLNNRNN